MSTYKATIGHFVFRHDEDNDELVVKSRKDISFEARYDWNEDYEGLKADQLRKQLHADYYTEVSNKFRNS